MSRPTRLQVVAVLTLLIATLGFTTSASAAPPPKVGVCHVDDDGNFVLISVSKKAQAAHIAHGDSSPGDTVPGTLDTFADDCTIIPAPATAVACATLGGAYADDGVGEITCGPILGRTFEEFLTDLAIWNPACLGTPGAVSSTGRFISSDPSVSTFGCRYS